MRKVINIIGKLLSDEDIDCIYSYAVEDPMDLLMDLIKHTSNKDGNMYVLTINNKRDFGHNFKIILNNKAAGVYVLQTIRYRIDNYFKNGGESELIIDLEKLVQSVESSVEKM